MSEQSSNEWQVNWTLRSQAKEEARYELKNELYCMIGEYITISKELGLSTEYVRGLEQAADIVMISALPQKEKYTEVQL